MRTHVVPALIAGLVLSNGCTGSGTATPSPSATAAPRSAGPVPTGYPGGIRSSTGPVQSGFTRYSGFITDLNGEPIPEVCVYAGPPSGCPSPSLVTDAGGRWQFDFPSGLVWQFNFEHPGYESQLGIVAEKIEIKLAPKTA